MDSDIIIRKAVLSDIDRLMEIFSRARDFMKSSGNPNQWINGYPQRELIEEEISKEHCYVCCLRSGNNISTCSGSDDDINDQHTGDSGFNDRVVATFCFIEGPDPTYSYIEDGNWPSSSPYYVIHRLASDGTVSGISSICIEWCLGISPCVRADTHQDNKVMQHILQKNGFERCGIIYVANGTPRIAYQKDISGC